MISVKNNCQSAVIWLDNTQLQKRKTGKEKHGNALWWCKSTQVS